MLIQSLCSFMNIMYNIDISKYNTTVNLNVNFFATV